MAFNKGFNFRSTSAFVTDGANETWVNASDIYPTTRNGVTFGWVTTAPSAFDSVAGNDRRLAGNNQQTNNGTQRTFRVDLPASGTYQVQVAQGDPGSAQAAMYFQVQDNGTALLTLNQATTTLANNFFDATNTKYTNVTWPSSETAVGFSFATTTLLALLGTPTASSNGSPIAHLFVSDGAAPAGGGWVSSGTRRAPAKAGPFDQRGFLLSPFQQYSYAPSFTLNAYSFSADPGTYAVTGAAAGLRRGAALPALAGSYTLTGAAAKLLVGHAVNAGTATYAINGVSSTELRTLLLNASSGSYTLSGFAATLQAPSPDHPLTVNPATYALTGANAATQRGVRTTVTGAYAISGAPALFLIQRGVPDGPSSYNVNGLAATLIYSGSGPASRVPWQRMGMRIGL